MPGRIAKAIIEGTAMIHPTFPNRFASAAMVFAALLLMFGFSAQTKAHADDFAAGNAALLDPFDPVPQIRFSDCYDDCGYRRHCCRRHWNGDYGGRRLWTDEAVWWQRIYEFDYNTHRWNGAMARYDSQADQYDDLMHDRYGHHWHGDRGGPWKQPADWEWWQDGDRWLTWHENGWHDDGYDGHWHDDHHDRH
jgi:hypothetical protein